MTESSDEFSRYIADHVSEQMRAVAAAEDAAMSEAVRSIEEVFGHHLFMRATGLPPGATPSRSALLDATDVEWFLVAPLTPTSALYARPVRWWSIADRRRWRRETRVALEFISSDAKS